MTGLSERVLAEIDRAAEEIVASFPPLTGEDLAEISRLFAGTNVPQSVGGTAGRVGTNGVALGGVVPRDTSGAASHELPQDRRSGQGVRVCADESRPVAGADLTGALTVRPTEKGRPSRGARAAVDISSSGPSRAVAPTGPGRDASFPKP